MELKTYDEFINQQFGDWTVLSFAGRKGKNKKRPYMTCQCSCGKIKNVSLYSLKSGKSKSCGHNQIRNFINNNPNPPKDEKGNRYGRLLVLERAKKENQTRAYWRCKCDCGKEIITSGKDLRSGKILSCGCYKADLLRQHRMQIGGVKIGNVYGYLTVIQQGDIIDGHQHWLCKCRCGNLIDLTTAKLNGYKFPSCGCIVSKGEAKIADILREHQIPFKKEYSFDDLYINDGKARFDFALLDDNDNLLKLIEYQGRQHYNPNDDWYNPDSDKKKKDYCQSHNIELIEIPYTDFGILNWDYLKEKCNL